MKAQVATEYLIILAIVIVVSLIAVGVVRSVINVNTWFNPALNKIEWTAKEVVLDSISIYENQAAVRLINNANYPIVVTHIGVGVDAQKQDTVTIYPGYKKTIELKPGSYITGEAGQTYTLKVTIIYHDMDDEILQSSVSGTVTGIYQ